MKIATHYSHLNGLEFLQIHRPDLWSEIQEAIASIDAASCRTKVSRERRTKDKLFYSPVGLNQAMRESFRLKDWREQRTSY